jgi:hypothetical protein
MIIVKAEEVKEELLKEINDREFSERVGVHCSDLIYCLNKQVLRKALPLLPQEHSILLFSLGWSTQRWLTGKDKDEEPVEVDGILVTKDALREGIPWELKATFKSSTKVIEEEDSWLAQIKAQCYTMDVLEAYLSRVEIMGNWKSIFGKKEEKDFPENRKPTLSVFKLIFTKEELEDNWNWLLSRKKLYLKLLADFKKNNVLLPAALSLPINHAWECGYCPNEYRKICLGE